MIELMPEKTQKFIEAECLKVARSALGCGYLERVLIERTKPVGSGPNWQVFGFRPALPTIAHAQAIEVIGPLRDRYALEASPRRP